MELTGTASGKLILFGEHAAVHGYSAVGLSLPMKTRVNITRTDEQTWSVPGTDMRDSETVVDIVGKLERLMGSVSNATSGVIKISSTVPRGVGFGSSAALCGAIARALVSGSELNDMKREEANEIQRQQGVWELAHSAERVFHGTPSGIDTGLALYEGLFGFHMQPPNLPTLLPIVTEPLHLVIGAVPRKREARALIGSIGRAVSEKNQLIIEKLSLLGNIADRAMSVFSERNKRMYERLGGLAVTAQKLLAGLGLSTPELDFLLSKGMEAGAVGGKLSGAGGGGAFFLLFNGEITAMKAAEYLRTLAATKHIENSAWIRAYTTAFTARSAQGAHSPDPCLTC
jgi:mevalonate kinase